MLFCSYQYVDLTDDGQRILQRLVDQGITALQQLARRGRFDALLLRRRVGNIALQILNDHLRLFGRLGTWQSIHISTSSMKDSPARAVVQRRAWPHAHYAECSALTRLLARAKNEDRHMHD